MTKIVIAIITAALTAIPAAVPARAEPAIGVTATCPITGPGILVCGAVGVAVHEFVQMANGKKGFGREGELMKLATAPAKILQNNMCAANGERGEIAKVVRATVGISEKDIRKYGVFGGKNSVFRKPFG